MKELLVLIEIFAPLLAIVLFFVWKTGREAKKAVKNVDEFSLFKQKSRS